MVIYVIECINLEEKKFLSLGVCFFWQFWLQKHQGLVGIKGDDIHRLMDQWTLK